MRIFLAPTKEGEGKYRDISFETTFLPTLHGVRIEKLELTAEDVKWLGTFNGGKTWFVQHLLTRFVAK